MVFYTFLIRNFVKIGPFGAELFNADEQDDREGMTKLKVATQQCPRPSAISRTLSVTSQCTGLRSQSI